jgi:hypothetical protein
MESLPQSKWTFFICLLDSDTIPRRRKAFATTELFCVPGAALETGGISILFIG